MNQIASMRSAGERYERGLAQFIAEQGYMPMYGMPTCVRPRYLGLTKKGGNEVKWDSVDRDVDLAIGEFAPLQVLVRDKQKHQAIGFTATLRPPKLKFTDTINKDNTQWSETDYYIARCQVCEGTVARADLPEAAIRCVDCGADIQIPAFKRFYVPSAFRTSFKPIEVDEEVAMTPVKRSIVAEIYDLETAAVSGTNLTIHAGSGATVLRLNEGPIGEETGEGIGYTVKHVAQTKVWLPRGMNGHRPRLENQFVLPDATTKFPSDWEDGDLGTETGILLMSRKPTEALYLGMETIPAGLAVDLFSREPHGSSLRAAAISATHLIVQRASLEMDVDPDEFEVLEPRKRSGLPLLQITDSLINGAGFSRRLAEQDGSGQRFVVQLICSMLNDPNDRLVGRFHAKDHRRTAGNLAISACNAMATDRTMGFWIGDSVLGSFVRCWMSTIDLDSMDIGTRFLKSPIGPRSPRVFATSFVVSTPKLGNQL